MVARIAEHHRQEYSQTNSSDAQCKKHPRSYEQRYNLTTNPTYSMIINKPTVMDLVIRIFISVVGVVLNQDDRCKESTKKREEERKRVMMERFMSKINGDTVAMMEK